MASVLCIEACKHKGRNKGDMIRCCFCARWYHTECVGIKSETENGIWPCSDCRQINTRVTTLLDTVNHLATLVGEMNSKLDESEKARAADRLSTEREYAILLDKNAKLERDIASMTERLNALTWKTFRQMDRQRTLLIGSSIIRNVDEDKLHDTDVICLPGGKIADVKRKIDALQGDYEEIALVVGGNDCNMTPPKAANEIVEEYGQLIDAAQTKARAITVSSVCPRLKGNVVANTIESVNAGLVTLCNEKSASFADNTPAFTLRDGSINDGYLHADGVHITETAMNKVATTMKLRVRNATQGVCKTKTDKTREEKRRVESQKPRSSIHRSANDNRRDSRRRSVITDLSVRRCEYCSEPGHCTRDCGFKSHATCRQCGEKGHKQKFCVEYQKW